MELQKGGPSEGFPFVIHRTSQYGYNVPLKTNFADSYDAMNELVKSYLLSNIQS